MSAVKLKEGGFLIISVLLSTMLLSFISVLSFKEILSNYKYLVTLNENLEKNKKQIEDDYQDCNLEEYHSNLSLKICENQKLIIFQK